LASDSETGNWMEVVAKPSGDTAGTSVMVTAGTCRTPMATPQACISKWAVTDWFARMLRTQGAVPEQPPPCQPTKTEPGVGLATRLTRAPSAKLVLQVEPQSIPEGLV